MNEQEMKAALENLKGNVFAMSQRRTTVNWGTLGIVALLLFLFGGFYLHSVRTYERLLGKAEEREAKYEARLKEIGEKWERDRERIIDLTKEKAKVTERIVYRDREADTKIAEVTQPQRSTDSVAHDVLDAYGFSPITAMDGMFTFGTPETQTFVATKIDRDRLDGNLTDTKKILDLEQEKSSLLQQNLDQAQTQMADSLKVIEGYKKVAKKNKKQKFFDAVKKVTIFVGGVAIGRALTR